MKPNFRTIDWVNRMVMDVYKPVPLLNKIIAGSGLSKMLEESPNEDEIRLAIKEQWCRWVAQKNEFLSQNWQIRLERAMIEDNLEHLFNIESTNSKIIRNNAASSTAEEILIKCKLLAPELFPVIAKFFDYLRHIIFVELAKMTTAGKILLKRPSVKRIQRLGKVQV